MPDDDDLKLRFSEAMGQKCVKGACRLAALRYFPRREVWSSLGLLRGALASHGVTIKADRDSEHEGLIEFSPSGAVGIRIRPSRSKARNRFTVAHEVAHWIIRREVFPEFVAGSETAYRGLRYTAASKRSEEFLANMLAAELLMPTDEMMRIVRGCFGDAHGAIRRTTSRFVVSRVAAVRRMADVLEATVLWLRMIETGCRHGHGCDVDEVVFAVPDTTTLLARDRIWLDSRVGWGSARGDASGRRSMVARFATPRGMVGGRFDVRAFGEPAPCMEVIGFSRNGSFEMSDIDSVIAVR